MQAKQQNQQNPPRPKKKRMDAKGNDYRRIFVKSGTATLMLADGLTDNACDILMTKIEESIKSLGGNLRCSFLKIK